MLLKINHNDMKPIDFAKTMLSLSRNDQMREKLQLIIQLAEQNLDIDPSIVVNKIGEPFQLKAIEAFPCALWNVIKYWSMPEECIIQAVNMGGDSDTVGSIAGAMIGALHGTKWIPNRWFNNCENGERGRDYAIDLGKKLSELHCNEIIHPEEYV